MDQPNSSSETNRKARDISKSLGSMIYRDYIESLLNRVLLKEYVGLYNDSVAKNYGRHQRLHAILSLAFSLPLSLSLSLSRRRYVGVCMYTCMSAQEMCMKYICAKACVHMRLFIYTYNVFTCICICRYADM